MKRKLTPLCLLLAFSIACCGQTLSGIRWYVDEIIGKDTLYVQEFILSKKPVEKFGSFGYDIVFSEDSTFSAFNEASCGNDCFPSSKGNYSIPQPGRVRLYVQEYSQMGYCENLTIPVEKDFGEYALVKESENILKLIKLTGDEKQDELNRKYSTIMDAIVAKYRGNRFSDVLKYSPEATYNEERVAEYLKNVLKITEFQVLYNRKAGNQYLVNLVKVRGRKNLFVVNNIANNYSFKVGSVEN